MDLGKKSEASPPLMCKNLEIFLQISRFGLCAIGTPTLTVLNPLENCFDFFQNLNTFTTAAMLLYPEIWKIDGR